MQAVEYAKQLISDQLRWPSHRYERVQPDRHAHLIGGIEQHDVIDPLLGDPGQDVFDELTLGLDYHHATAGLEVLGDEVQKRGGLP
jgi:hypothetical protein